MNREDGGHAPLLEGAPPAPKDAGEAAPPDALPFVLSPVRYYVMSVYFLAWSDSPRC